MKRKTVHLNGVGVGSASTWHEVAMLVSKLLHRIITVREALENGSEGPDGFFITMRT